MLLESEYLQSTLLCAGDNRNKPLAGQGVRIWSVGDGRIFYDATDGHIAYRACRSSGRDRANIVVAEQIVKLDLVIPAETLKMLAPALRDDSRIRLEGNQIGPVRFNPRKADLPAIGKIFPDKCSGKAGNYNPAFILKLQKALCRRNDVLNIWQNGPEGIAICRGTQEDALGLLRPCKMDILRHIPGWAHDENEGPS